MTFFRNMEWLTSFLSAVRHYILILLEEDSCAAARKPPPLSCPGCCRGQGISWQRSGCASLEGSWLFLGKDFCNEGISWEENPASRTWSTGETAEKGRERTSRPSSEPDKKETFPAQRGICRVCSWKIPGLSPSLEERPLVTRLWHTHEDTPSVRRRWVLGSLSQ